MTLATNYDSPAAIDARARANTIALAEIALGLDETLDHHAGLVFALGQAGLVFGAELSRLERAFADLAYRCADALAATIIKAASLKARLAVALIESGKADEGAFEIGRLVREVTGRLSPLSLELQALVGDRVVLLLAGD